MTANSFIKRPGGAAPIGLAAVHLSRQFSASVGSEANAPVGTITAGGGGKTALVAAFLAQHNAGPRPGAPGRDAHEPISTITAAGSQQAVVSAGMISLKGSDRRDRPVEEPAATICAGGTHAAEVRAFMVKYYGSDQDPRLDEPLHTATTKARFGLVTVTINGEPYVIVDIGTRMLAPRELFRAQGFPDSYIIDCGVVAGEPVTLTKTAQVRMCGNSVCPDVARALVAANYQDFATLPISKMRPLRSAPLLEAAE
ncbi:MAG: DNA cytosine methyltransferase [Methylocella sp.]